MILFLQLLVAFALGALLMYGFTRVRGGENAEIQRLRRQLETRTQDLEAYKSDVQEHFLGTAEAVDTLTKSYRGVFEELERGANRLVGETRFRDALNDRASLARGVPTIAVIDETPADRVNKNERSGQTPQLSRGQSA